MTTLAAAPSRAQTAAPAAGVPITVVAGTYGANCKQPGGNVTKHLAEQCNGKQGCDYVIDSRIIGDPAQRCAKSYVAEWQCGGAGQAFSAAVPSEAGDRKTVTLSCPPPAAPKAHSIGIAAATYGPNCKARRGNVTADLASQCNGKGRCDYLIDVDALGDPAPKCSKNYVAEYTCGGTGPTYFAAVPPEAGSRKTLSLSCSPRPVANPNAISILAGTYGPNCKGARGNMTADLAARCNGRARCHYTVDVNAIGDPAAGCAKSYLAEWQCGAAGPVHTAAIPAEAGTGKKVALSCEPAPTLGPTTINVVAGTYGSNCARGRGNATPHLAGECNGKTDCEYVVDYRVLGDPAGGCAKSYVAEWQCGAAGQLMTASIPAEAGERKTVKLSCAPVVTATPTPQPTPVVALPPAVVVQPPPAVVPPPPPPPPAASAAVNWAQLSGAAIDVGVGANGTTWVIGTNRVPGGFGIYRWNGSAWQVIAGGAVRVAVDPHGNAWVVNDAGAIYQWNGSGWVNHPGQAKDIGIGSNGAVWVIGWNAVPGGFGIYQWNGRGWTPIDGGAVKIAVAPNGMPWVVNSAGQIFRRDGSRWSLIAGPVALDVGVGPDNSVWITGKDQSIHRLHGSAWLRAPGAAVNVSVGPGGMPWVTNAGMNIYRAAPTPPPGVAVQAAPAVAQPKLISARDVGSPFIPDQRAAAVICPPLCKAPERWTGQWRMVRAGTHNVHVCSCGRYQ